MHKEAIGSDEMPIRNTTTTTDYSDNYFTHLCLHTPSVVLMIDHWVPGHKEIKGNELADEQAKEAASEMSKPDVTVEPIFDKGKFKKM